MNTCLSLRHKWNENGLSIQVSITSTSGLLVCMVECEWIVKNISITSGVILYTGINKNEKIRNLYVNL